VKLKSNYRAVDVGRRIYMLGEQRSADHDKWFSQLIFIFIGSWKISLILDIVIVTIIIITSEFS